MAEGTTKRPVKRFRLKRSVQGHAVGTHYEPNPDFDPDLPEEPGNLREIAYEPGQVVKTHRDLNVIFENKFTPFDKMARDIQDEEDEELAATRENAAHLEETRKAAKESEEFGKRAKKEGIITKERGHGNERFEETEPEDDDSSPSVRDPDTAREAASKKTKNARASDEDEEDVEEEEAVEEEEFEDVSDDFPDAGEIELNVRKRGDHYFVYEKGEDEPMRGNRKGFTKKSEVKAFIKKQVQT